MNDIDFHAIPRCSLRELVSMYLDCMKEWKKFEKAFPNRFPHDLNCDLDYICHHLVGKLSWVENVLFYDDGDAGIERGTLSLSYYDSESQRETGEMYGRLLYLDQCNRIREEYFGMVITGATYPSSVQCTLVVKYQLYKINNKGQCSEPVTRFIVLEI